MHSADHTDSDHGQWETVNRVVYPVRDRELLLPLYVVEWTRPHLTDDVIDPRLNLRRIDFDGMDKKAFRHLVEDSVSLHGGSAGYGALRIDSRTTLTVRAGRRVCLCTFFNAFPAGYWKRWTSVDSVRFTATVRGRGEIVLYRSTGRGLFTTAGTCDVDSGTESAMIDVTLPMTGLLDGGYFWFDAGASTDSELSVKDAAWSVPRSRRTATSDTTLSVAITTFNRPTYCLDQLRTIAADAELRRRLDTVYCVDQGTDLVRNQSGFADVADELGDQLTYLRQTNMGGSAGFSRGMYETVKAGRSSATLLLDDDAISEPESILRAKQFADYTKHPTIVGGGMFHLDNRTVLYTQGERLDLSRIWMKPSLGLDYNHDFARFPLRDSPERHRRIDSDFNGWWMCLIPTAVMRDIGLSMPFFIKFDDTEYCLRAREHGYPTVCLPGVAVWHQAWHDKDPARTWEEYFFQRNRWICGLLHSPRPSWRFGFEMLYGDLNVGLKLIYSALELRHMGLRDIMRGPGYIVDTLPSQLRKVRQARSGYDDAKTSGNLDDFPEPLGEFTPGIAPTTAAGVRKAGIRDVLHALLSRRDGRGAERPDVIIPADQVITWESFSGVRSAVVVSPDGNTAAWFRRNGRLFRRGIREGIVLAARMLHNWKDLSRRYRDYDMSGLGTWERIFSASAAAPDVAAGTDETVQSSPR